MAEETTNEPTMTKDGRPFVLAWLEKRALDRLKSGDAVISDSTDTLRGSGPFGEDVESTSHDPQTASIDTSIHF